MKQPQRRRHQIRTKDVTWACRLDAAGGIFLGSAARKGFC